MAGQREPFETRDHRRQRRRPLVPRSLHVILEVSDLIDAEERDEQRQDTKDVRHGDADGRQRRQEDRQQFDENI